MEPKLSIQGSPGPFIRSMHKSSIDEVIGHAANGAERSVLTTIPRSDLNIQSPKQISHSKRPGLAGDRYLESPLRLNTDIVQPNTARPWVNREHAPDSGSLRDLQLNKPSGPSAPYIFPGDLHVGANESISHIIGMGHDSTINVTSDSRYDGSTWSFSDTTVGPEISCGYSNGSIAGRYTDVGNSDASKPRSKHRRQISRFAAPIGELAEPAEDPFDWEIFSPLPVSPPRSEEPRTGIPGRRQASVCSNPSRPVSGHEQWASLQDILSTLAQKEREVLEARQKLNDAEDALLAFRTRVDRMTGPIPCSLNIPCRPVIIPRHHSPNIGINTLNYKWSSASIPSEFQAWELEDSESGDLSVPVPLRVVNCLLKMVHCIIKRFPTYQGQGEFTWQPVYPSATRILYGYIDYHL